MRVKFPFPEEDEYYSTRRSLIDICGGDHCAASLLDALIYWDSIRRGAVKQEYIRASLDSTYLPSSELWIYKSIAHWSEDLCGHYGETAIRAGLKVLIAKKFATTRSNPKNPLDRTPQYLLEYEEVKGAVKRWESSGKAPRILSSHDPVKTRDARRENENMQPVKTRDGPLGNEGCSYTEVTSTETTLPEGPSPVFKNSSLQNQTSSEVVANSLSALRRKTKAGRIKGKEMDDLTEKLPALIEAHGGVEVVNAFVAFLQDPYWAERKFPVYGFLKQFDKYVSLQNPNHPSAQPRHASAGPQEDGNQHPPTSQAAPSPILGFPARWNELVPEAPVDPSLLGKNPKPYSDPAFAERFDEICAKARALIKAGADLKFGFLLKLDPSTERYRWQELLSDELGWLKPRVNKKDAKADPFANLRKELGIA